MKKDWTRLECYRVRRGEYASNPGDDYGLFMIPVTNRRTLQVIASTGMKDVPGAPDVLFEHASVVLRYRNEKGKTRLLTPDWQDMCLVKELFWEDDEVVMQLHPAKLDYVNVHEQCLHLWRPWPEAGQIPLPPKCAV